MATKKTTIKKLIPLVLIAGGIFYGIKWWKNRNAASTEPIIPIGPGITPSGPTPPTPPTGPIDTPTPPTYTPKPIQIGKACVITADTNGFVTEWRGTAYPKGGSNEKGIIEKGKYGGIVNQINDLTKSVQVTNYQYAMKNANGQLVYTFWVPFANVIGI